LNIDRNWLSQSLPRSWKLSSGQLYRNRRELGADPLTPTIHSSDDNETRSFNGGTKMGEMLTPTHLMVVAAVAIVLFGGKKIPELGRGLGEGLRGLRME